MSEAGKGPPQGKALEEPLIENVLAPELFVTHVSAYSVFGQNVTVGFASRRWDSSAEPNGGAKMVVVGRLTMPIPCAVGLAVELFNFLQKNGIEIATPAEKASPN